MKHQLDCAFKPFTTQLTKDAIMKSLNSAAAGPDGLTSLHLKYLGPKGIAYLNYLFNLSLAPPPRFLGIEILGGAIHHFFNALQAASCTVITML
jgi:hypothetical protein